MRRPNHSDLTSWIFVLFSLWFGSYAYEYVYVVAGLKPLYSYIALVAFATVFVAARSAAAAATVPADRYVSAFYMWLLCYLAYGIVEFVNSSEDAIAVQAFVNLVEAVVLTAIFVMMMRDSRRLARLSAAFAALAVFGAIMNIWDFMVPTFSKVPGRAAGFYVNPTIAGNFIVLAMVAGMTSTPRRLRIGFLTVCGAGVVVTFSRESWIIWGLGTMFLGWQGFIGKKHERPRFGVVILAGVLGVGATALLFTGTIGRLVENSVLQNYLTPNTISRLGVGDAVASGASADLRREMVTNSLREGSYKPWIGHGLGYTEEWAYPVGPHDMYLLFLVEGGLAGVTVYLALLVLLWRASIGTGRVATILIIVSSIFSHNHLEQPAILMMFAFVVAHGSVTRRESGVRDSAMAEAFHSASRYA